jgi:hypothetical protein
MYNAKTPPVSVEDSAYALGKLQSDAILASIAVHVAAHPEDLTPDVWSLALDATKVFLPASVASLVNNILDARFSARRQEASV